MRHKFAVLSGILALLLTSGCAHLSKSRPSPPPQAGVEVTNALLTSIALALDAPLPVAAGFPCEIEKISPFPPFETEMRGICDADNYASTCREAAAQADARCDSECGLQNKRATGWPDIVGDRCAGDVAGVARPPFDKTEHCITDNDGDVVGVACTVTASCQCDP